MINLCGFQANSSLEVFRFDNNHVGEEGCKAIAGMIEGSDRLHELYLEHCAINDIGAKKIGSGIEKSTAGTLEKLVVRIVSDRILPYRWARFNVILLVVASEQPNGRGRCELHTESSCRKGQTDTRGLIGKEL